MPADHRVDMPTATANPRRPVRAILFDLDGTLLDTAGDIALALRRSFAALGLEGPTDEAVRRMIGRGAPILVERACANLGLPQDTARNAALLQGFFAQYGALPGQGDSRAQPYPGVRVALEALRAAGLPLAVVTNKQEAFARQLLRHLALDHFFKRVVGGDTCARRKPDPQPLEWAAGQLGVGISDTLMVGDSRNDVQAARAAGMRVVAVPYGYNEGEDPATLDVDALLPDLSHLPAWLGLPAHRQGPLQGLRVLELASVGPGPMAAMLLADLGAEVLRVDRLQPSGLGLPVAPEFDVTARNRRSIALDTRHAAGRDVVLRLLEDCDVLIEGFRPGAAERMGLGPQDCLARNPRLIYGRMTGYGQTGPLAQTVGHDLNYIALTGALHAMGPQHGAPMPPLNLVGDYGGGALYLAFGIMAAVFERQHSGQGQVVDAAMLDGTASLLSLFHGLRAAGEWKLERGVNLLDGGAPFYTTYQTADGGWYSVAPLEPKFFAAFAQAIGLAPQFAAGQFDRSLWPAMREAIATTFQRRSRAQWQAAFEGLEVCCAPVLNLDEAQVHPQAVAREAFVAVGGMMQPAPAPRFGRSPAAWPKPAPQVGEHSAEVLFAAGYSEAEQAALRAVGVLG